MRSAASRKIWIIVGTIAAVLAVVFVVFRRQSRRSKPDAPVQYRDLPFRYFQSNLSGLSEEEAASKMPAFDRAQLAREEKKKFLLTAFRVNLLSTFNIDIFAIALVMLFLGSPASAIGTMFVLLLNVVINVLQVMITKNRLDHIVEKLKPQATVLRDGRLRSIDPVQIVEGDLLTVGSGDQILVDGELVGDSAITIEEAASEQFASQVEVKAGNPLSAGSNCVSGHGLYRATQAGYARYHSVPVSNLQLLQGVRTPLEKLMEIILRSLLIIVIIFSAIFIIDSFLISAELVPAVYREAFSIVFAVAPTSLFFILIMQYAMGTLRMSDLGALVYHSHSIEALSNVSAICLSDRCLMEGVEVKIEPIATPPGYTGLSENAIRHLIGDALHSLPTMAIYEGILDDAFPGTRRHLVENAVYLMEFGWMAASFDDPDQRGTFVLGFPEIIKNKLIRGESETVRKVGQTVSNTKGGISRWTSRIFRRKNAKTSAKMSGSKVQEPPQTQPDVDELPKPIQLIPDDFYQRPAWQQKMITGLQNLLTPMEERQPSTVSETSTQNQIRFLCAYWPEPLQLHDRHGRVQLPRALIPLAYMELNSKVRPEARQVLKKFIDAGLQVKILSSQNAERVLWTVKSMGWETAGLKTISGLELGKIEQRDLPDRIHSTMLFCELSPAQKASIIESLQKQGEYVAMVGDNVNDVPSMLKANLRFALRSSVQAALSLTDIVLIRDSLDALPSILTTGQRLVNSVVDTFKLYLSQVISQLIMIVAVLFFGFRHFPFNSTQGGIISAFTIALPNIILSAWSAAGMLSGAEIRRRLLRFIIPSSITLSILSFAVFELFWRLNLPAVFPPKLLQNLQVTDARLFYAQMAVTFALLFAGWLRLLFLQPPTQFWVGGAPLRGDSRVYYVVLGVAGLLVVFIIFPFLPFQEWLRVTWLPRFQDYLLIGAFVIIWCFILRAIWRINWIGVTRKVFSQSIERKGITVSHEKAKIEAVR